MAASTVASNFSLPCAIPLPMTPDNRRVLQQLNDDTMSPEGLGAATLFTDPEFEGSKPWPVGTDNRNTIAYCYDDPTSYTKLRSQVGNAIKQWLTALGGQASETSGHNLVFQEMKDERGRPMYCNQKGADYDWNPRLSWYTLSIEYKESQEIAAATVGLVVYLNPPVPWTTTLFVGPKTDDADMIYEFGDQWVLYACQNLYDFDEVWARVRDKPGMTKEKLCEDPWTALKEKFSGLPFVKNLSLGGARLDSDNPFLHVRPGGDYDTSFIMHYGSKGSSRNECDQNHMESCALLKYKEHGNPSGGYEWIPRHTAKPSSVDIAWVKAVYPWRG
ncbi:hypothetical protein BDV96DRAFT_693413 [Lophiotrema nucula]|uniref:Uncharacterized protein n=1 Tax=Lophiotrema nucula TaxID=690887 RepID=A0A6A5YKA4_9PLEO|nr:hypothetical protein BDV96DRAFT_693413 [Lophiotrema nucula]